MRLCWYGDDFTGATDTLAEVARAGRKTLLFMGLPDAARLRAAGPLDAIGIAGAARGMTPAEMQQALEPVGRFAAEHGVRILHYKCCSTFDSAPHIGSIGAAAAILRPYLPNARVAIVGGQPSIGRYCSFAQLFARAGNAPGVYRIDRHPVMRQHPVTPMHEADLRLHLAQQGLLDIQSIAHTSYPQDEAGIAPWMAQLPASGNLLFDVIDARQLPLIGGWLDAASREAPLLVIGASSVQQALAPQGVAVPASQVLGPAQGPVLMFAGSLSPVTAAQIKASRLYLHQPITVARLSDAAYLEQQTAQAVAQLRAGRHVLVHTDRPDTAVSSEQAAATARATGTLVAAIVRAAGNVRRVGIAGGDTSSQATLALGAWALAFHSVIAPGVTVSLTRADEAWADGLELMLKGGQMGGEGLFDQWVEGRHSLVGG